MTLTAVAHHWCKSSLTRPRIWLAKSLLPKGFGVVKEVGWEDIRV